MGKYYLLFVLFLCPTLFAIQDGFYGGVNLFAGRGKTSVKTLGVDNNAPNVADGTENRSNNLTKSLLFPGLSLSYLVNTNKIIFAPELYFDFNLNSKSNRFLVHADEQVSLELKEKNKFSAGINFKVGNTLSDEKFFAYGLFGFGVNSKKYRSRLVVNNGDPSSYENKSVKEFNLNLGIGGDYFLTESSALSLRLECNLRPARQSVKVRQILDDGNAIDFTNTATLKSKSNYGVRIGYTVKLY